jgi:hypothetical protein
MAGANFSLSVEDDWQRGPRPAYSPVMNKYLVVWVDHRNHDIHGRLVNANGSLSGSTFPISAAANYQWNPDIAYNPTSDQFLVVFDDDRLVAYDNDIYGKLVNADGTLSGNDFTISTPSEDQLLPVVAHNTSDNQFLVVWQDDRNAATNADIYAQLVNGNGSMDGGNFPISTASSDQGYPDVAYDSYRNQYLAVWVQSADVYGRLIRADGSFPGPEFQIAAGPGGLSDPSVEFDPNSKQFLVAWSSAEGWDNIYARLVSTDGTMPEPQFDVVYSSGNHWYPDLAFNSQTREFLIVWRHMECLTTFNCEDSDNNDKYIAGALYRAAATFGSYLPAVLRGFQPVPPPPPTATVPAPTSTPVTPSATPTQTSTPTITPTPTATGTTPPPAWTTILTEDFEGAFPGPWWIFDNLPGYGEYVWNDRPCQAFSGSWSGWAVGGGADGGSLSCGSTYPNNAESWMVYGPFSLADATDAEMRFKLWLNTQPSSDYACWMASINGANFYGDCLSGDSGGWMDQVMDLTAVNTLGDLTGEPEVWVLLRFFSDTTIGFSEGAHVDDILLRKCTAGGCTLAAPERPAPGGSLFMIPAELTLEGR